MKKTFVISLLLLGAAGTARGETGVWWESYQDRTLTALIDSAEAHNPNALSALRSIEAASQARRAVQAAYYPTLGATAGWSRQRTSGDMQAMKGHAQTMSYFNLGLTMNWELDVFGRVQARMKAANADLKASEADYQAALVSLRANVAKTYFNLRMAQAEIGVAERNITNAEELLRIARTRHEVGLVPSVDVLQAQIVVTQTRATLPQLKADVTSAINQIAILTGVRPDRMDWLREASELPAPAGQLTMISEDECERMLEQRPDVEAARMQLEAMEAQVGIAKKDWLPTLSLSAGAGTEAHNLKDMFGRESFYYEVMPTLSWTIFNGFARNANIAEAKARLEAETESYRLTKLTALGEVGNARAAWESSVEQRALYKKILNDARKELTLQIDRYKQGLCDFTDVANAQTAVLEYENSVIEAQAGQLTAEVTLYTALGM